jgi:hypothetical protein
MFKEYLEQVQKKQYHDYKEFSINGLVRVISDLFKSYGENIDGMKVERIQKEFKFDPNESDENQIFDFVGRWFEQNEKLRRKISMALSGNKIRFNK